MLRTLRKKKDIAILLFVLILFSARTVLCGELEEAKKLGESLANEARNALGTKEGITERIKKPIMSGKTPMKTLKPTYRCTTSNILYTDIAECQDKCSGECREYEGFNAQLQCPSAVAFLKITVLPLGTSDFNLIVSQDTNLDGEIDYGISKTG